MLLLFWLVNGCGQQIQPVHPTHPGYDDQPYGNRAESVAKEPAWRIDDQGGYSVDLESAIYRDGRWQAEVTLNQKGYDKGDTMEVAAEVAIQSEYIRNHRNDFDHLIACLTSLRLYDKQGDPHRKTNIGMSTVLTPTGLPIEIYNPGQASQKIGKTWTGPIDQIHRISTDQLIEKEDALVARFALSVPIGPEFPDGYYRPEINFYLEHQGEVTPLSLWPGWMEIIEQKRPIHFYPLLIAALTTHKLPLVRIGNPHSPRMIWTLFSGNYSNGTLGVVAREDRERFAFSSNRTFQAEFVAARTDREGRPISYRLEPEFPLIQTWQMPSVRGTNPDFLLPELPLDYHSGSLDVRVVDPDGVTERLGKAPFVGQKMRGPTTGDPRFRYRFKKWGRHQVRLKGTIRDVWGHTLTGRGTYDVVVANRLTMDTSVKPGSPFLVNDLFSIMAVINPPGRAKIDIDLRFYPLSDPSSEQTRHIEGFSNRFGYFVSGPMLRFDVPGEYVVGVNASYTDSRGQLWYGSQKSAGVVAFADSDFVAHGYPWYPGSPDMTTLDRYNLGSEASNYREDTDYARNNCLTQQSLFFPYHSGDVLYIALNDTDGGNAITPNLLAEDKGGAVAPLIRRSFLNGSMFTSMLGQPGMMGPSSRRFGDIMYTAVHINRLLRFDFDKTTLPLFSESANGFSPHEYPEFMNRQAYYYAAAIRPGFVARQFVTENARTSIYWITSLADFHQIGSSADLEEDVYRFTGGVVFRDQASGIQKTGAYASMGVVLPKGSSANRVVAPLEEPIYDPMGTPFRLFIAVGPGLVLEQGDTLGLGGTVFPPVPAEAFGSISLPDGTTRTFRGACDSLGKCRYPDAAFQVDQPGVYRIRQTVRAGGVEGGIPGTVDGRYNHFVVPKDAKELIHFDMPPVLRFDPMKPMTIRGMVPPKVKAGVVYYMLLTPGAVLDQGEIGIEGGAFSYRIHFPDIQRRYKAFDLFNADRRPEAVDTSELTFFLEGQTEDGTPAFAARKILFRGSMVISGEPHG